MKAFVVIAAFMLSLSAEACKWDRDTLAEEKQKSPEMAEVIFGTASREPNRRTELSVRINSLKGHPQKSDPDWWNDLAGAYLRLENPQAAVDLLEPVVSQFPTNYGIHANLGTAYHLLGRFKDAEREIARDLEINPEGHLGVEKYHLALLQYLVRDAAYQKAHVYVDEWSKLLLEAKWNDFTLLPAIQDALPYGIDQPLSEGAVPSYRRKWNLATDTNFQAGVLYMGRFNPNDPACSVMLGVACLVDDHGDRNRDLNLAVAAFEKAIRQGSPQADMLQSRISQIKRHISGGQGVRGILGYVEALIVLILLVVLFIGFLRMKWPPPKDFTSIN